MPTPKKPRQPRTLLNNLSRLYWNACSAPPALYAETAFPALVNAVFDFLGPDPREIYHQARGNSLLCDIKGSIEDGEIIPAAEDSAATRFLFSSAEWFDRSTFYLFLAGVVQAGLMEWTSNIIDLAGCDQPDNPNEGTGTFFFGALPDSGDWRTLDFGFVSPSRYAPASPSSVFLDPGDTGFAMGHASFEIFGGGHVGTSCRLIVEQTGQVIDTHKNFKSDPFDATGPNMVWGSYTNNSNVPHTLSVQWSFGPADVPEHEVFPIPKTCSCFLSQSGRF